MNPGEIYWAELNSGRRPVVVVSRESLSRGTYVQIIPLTTAQFQLRSKFRNCVPFFAGQFGLPKDCVAQCEMLTVIEKEILDIDAGVIDILDDSKLREIIRAIGFALSAQCEPE